MTRRLLNVAIIGSGSAAFACAIRAAEGGARVTLIEERARIGGTCVNIGCVPSKIMIRTAEIAHLSASSPFAGLVQPPVQILRKALVEQQQARVDELRQARYQNILDDNPAIDLIQGRARFAGADTLEITLADGGKQVLKPDRILIASGASPMVPPVKGLAETPYWTSEEALLAESVPGHLIVLGGSAVGVELGQAFRRLGARVTILELMDRLLPGEDRDLGTGLREVLERDGIAVHTGFKTELAGYDARSGEFVLRSNGMTVTGDRLLVAAGRRPNTRDLGLEQAGVRLEQNGAIAVNERLETTVPNVYAAGDCTVLPQFVYVAAAAGTRAADNMLGGNAMLDLRVMPAVVFTDPQVATVGMNESAAREQGLEIEVKTLPLEHVPRALANFETHGFIRLVAEAGSGRLLGAQILAASAGEIIQIAAFAIRQGMTVHAIAGEMFPYLVMAEGIKLCAQTFTRDVARLSCCAG